METQTTKDGIEISPKRSGMTTETQIREQNRNHAMHTMWQIIRSRSLESCLAMGKTCKSCNKQKLFAKMCRSNQVNEIAEENSCSEEDSTLNSELWFLQWVRDYGCWTKVKETTRQRVWRNSIRNRKRKQNQGYSRYQKNQFTTRSKIASNKSIESAGQSKKPKHQYDDRYRKPLIVPKWDNSKAITGWIIRNQIHPSWRIELDNAVCRLQQTPNPNIRISKCKYPFSGMGGSICIFACHRTSSKM